MSLYVEWDNNKTGEDAIYTKVDKEHDLTETITEVLILFEF